MESLKVKDLVSEQILPVIFSAKDTVRHAIEVLAERNMTSAPVIKEPERDQLGFVDTLDLMCYLCYVATKPQQTRTVGPSSSLETDDIELLYRRNMDFNLGELGSIIDMSQRNPMYKVDSEDTVLKAVEFFKEGVHRLAVTKNGDESYILTQSAVVNWLAKNGFAENKTKLTMTQLGLCDTMRTVASVPQNTKAKDCFQFMKDQRTSAVAIVNETGELKSQFSASDLKGIGRYQFIDLLSTVEVFLEKHGKKPSVITLKPSSTLKEAVDLLSKEKVHRAYIVDENKTLKGVVSMTDIIRGVFN